jgi:hypothetical protein
LVPLTQLRDLRLEDVPLLDSQAPPELAALPHLHITRGMFEL